MPPPTNTLAASSYSSRFPGCNKLPQVLASTYTGTFAITNPVIAGVVRRSDGTPMPNALLNAGGGRSTRSDTNGAYRLALPPGWGGTVTPENGGWIFTPANRAYTELAADISGEDFTGALAEAIVISTTRSANSLHFGWPSAAGLQYQLQGSTNLVNWTNLGDVVAGSGSPLSITVPIKNAPVGFFRLEIH